MKSHPLAIAARYNDAESQEHGFQATVERQGFDMDEIIHVANQRALRIILDTDPALTPALKSALKSGKPVEVALTVEQAKLQVNLAAAILDGIMIGWRARGLAK
jgi:hypothetical protein